MKIAQKWKELKKRTGLYQFLIRSVVFFSILFGLYFALFLWIRHLPFFVKYLAIGDSYYIPWLSGLRKTDFLNAIVFAIIAFVVWNRESIKAVKPTRRRWGETVWMACLSLLSIAAHYFLKYWIKVNPGQAAASAGFLTGLKYLLLLCFVAFLGMAVYTLDFTRSFGKRHWKSILTFLAIGAVYFYIIQLFQKIWYHLSYFVAKTIYHMLSLTFDNVYFSPGTVTQGPRLGVEGFMVGISDACSGIDSLLLFLSLYTLLLVLDWKRLDLKRMFILFIPGIIGTVAYNILRVYVLLLVGVYYDQQFAIDTFHTNIGWILFLAFFMLFWHYGSKWVYLPRNKR